MHEHDDLTLTIGAGSSRLQLRVLRRSHPQCTDYWDGNWLNGDLAVTAGAFSGRVQAGIRTDELSRFLAQLQLLDRTLRGEAVLATMDFWLDVQIKGDGRGHFVAECWVRDEPGMGSRLEFQTHFDQTEIPPMLRSLRAILTAYPVIGDSNA